MSCFPVAGRAMLSSQLMSQRNGRVEFDKKTSLNSSWSKIVEDKMKSLSSSVSMPIKPKNTQSSLSCKPRKIITVVSLILLLSSSSVVFLDKSDVHALPTRTGGSGGGVPSIPTNAGGPNRGPVQIQSGRPPSDVQPNGGGTTHSEVRPSNTNCGGSNALIPGTSATNCAAPNVVHPTRAPNTATAQPANCDTPTTARHTNSPSTTVVHPTNCPPASSSSSNSVTINNVQSSSTTEQSTNAGLYDYLLAESNQNNVIPVANAGPNQIANSYTYVTLDGNKSYDPNGNSLGFSWIQVGGNPVPLSNYNTANPIFIAPIVPYPTPLTFQLIVNNGQANSSPSYVNITVEP
jgi:hypothetical protein